MAEEDTVIGRGGDFRGLLVKIKDGLSSPASGKRYLIPEQWLAQFEFTPEEVSAFDGTVVGELINVDYAVFKPGLIVFGSAGG